MTSLRNIPICGPLCQHPGCWEAAKKARLTHARLSSHSSCRLAKTARSLSPEDDLPTQKVVNLLDAFGSDPEDRYPGQLHEHGFRLKPAFLTEPPEVKSPKSKRIKPAKKKAVIESVPEPVPLKTVQVQEVFEFEELNTSWDDTFQSKKYYVWVPNPNRRPRNPLEFDPAQQSKLQKETSPTPLQPKDVTEQLVPKEIQWQREYSMMQKRSARYRDGKSPFYTSTHTSPTKPAYFGVYELLDLPRDVLTQVLEHVNERDFLDRKRFANALLAAIPKLEEKSHAIALANSQVLQQHKMEVHSSLEKRETSMAATPGLETDIAKHALKTSTPCFPRKDTVPPIGKSRVGHMTKVSLGVPDVSGSVTRPFQYNNQKLNLHLGPVVTPLPELSERFDRTGRVSTIEATIPSLSSQRDKITEESYALPPPRNTPMNTYSSPSPMKANRSMSDNALTQSLPAEGFIVPAPTPFTGAALTEFTLSDIHIQGRVNDKSKSAVNYDPDYTTVDLREIRDQSPIRLPTVEQTDSPLDTRRSAQEQWSEEIKNPSYITQARQASAQSSLSSKRAAMKSGKSVRFATAEHMGTPTRSSSAGILRDRSNWSGTGILRERSSLTKGSMSVIAGASTQDRSSTQQPTRVNSQGTLDSYKSSSTPETWPQVDEEALLLQEPSPVPNNAPIPDTPVTSHQSTVTNVDLQSRSNMLSSIHTNDLRGFSRDTGRTSLWSRESLPNKYQNPDLVPSPGPPPPSPEHDKEFLLDHHTRDERKKKQVLPDSVSRGNTNTSLGRSVRIRENSSVTLPSDSITIIGTESRAAPTGVPTPYSEYIIQEDDANVTYNNVANRHKIQDTLAVQQDEESYKATNNDDDRTDNHHPDGLGEPADINTYRTEHDLNSLTQTDANNTVDDTEMIEKDADASNVLDYTEMMAKDADANNLLDATAMEKDADSDILGDGKEIMGKAVDSNYVLDDAEAMEIYANFSDNHPAYQLERSDFQSENIQHTVDQMIDKAFQHVVVLQNNEVQDGSEEVQGDKSAVGLKLGNSNTVADGCNSTLSIDEIQASGNRSPLDYQDIDEGETDPIIEQIANITEVNEMGETLIDKHSAEDWMTSQKLEDIIHGDQDIREFQEEYTNEKGTSTAMLEVATPLNKNASNGYEDMQMVNLHKSNDYRQRSFDSTAYIVGLEKDQADINADVQVKYGDTADLEQTDSISDSQSVASGFTQPLSPQYMDNGDRVEVNETMFIPREERSEDNVDDGAQLSDELEQFEATEDGLRAELADEMNRVDKLAEQP